MSQTTNAFSPMANRFRGFLPVVIDVETGGFEAKTDALLEVAAVFLQMNKDDHLQREETLAFHIKPFAGANMEKSALQFNGIDPYNPLRGAVTEQKALEAIFEKTRKALKQHDCNRAILVGHNALFDHGFLKAAVQRNTMKRDPFHPFSCFDTVSLAGLAYGHTVLAKACELAGLGFNANEAHSAIYDAEKTADLFCGIVNRWQQFGGWPLQDREKKKRR